MSDQTVTSIAKFTGITINKTSNGTNKIVGGTQHTGILLGFGKIITDNININDITIDGTKSQTVGTIGQVDSASDVKNITVNKIKGRKCLTTEECNESKYWIEWTGTGSPGITVLKFDLTWKYNEYEYAE